MRITSIVFSLTALLVGEKLPPEVEIDVSSLLKILLILVGGVFVTLAIIFRRMIPLNWKLEELWTWRESKIGIGICEYTKQIPCIFPKDKYLNSSKTTFASHVGPKMRRISIWELPFRWKLIEEMKMQTCKSNFPLTFVTFYWHMYCCCHKKKIYITLLMLFSYT